MPYNWESLQKGLDKWNINLNAEQYDKLGRFYELLIETNKVMNLTAVTEFEDVCTKHFLDSIAMLHINQKLEIPTQGKSLIDVGCGAGFPGMVLKIAEPELNIVLMDALQKRVGFLNKVISELKLNVSRETYIGAIHGRAEELCNAEKLRNAKKSRNAAKNSNTEKLYNSEKVDFGKNMQNKNDKTKSDNIESIITEKAYRESFDFATARAVAKLSVLCEYCLPFVKKGGYFISYKTVESDDEIKSAESACTLLGGKIERVEDYILPGTDINRRLIYIKKIRATDKKYPRASAIMAKKPL